MSIELFLSDTADAACAAMTERLRKNNVAGSAHYVLVPDRFTLSMEAQILDALGLRGSSNIETLSFARLARKLTGGMKIMTPEAGVMLMRRILDENRGKLGALRNASASAGFAHDIYAVIADLRNNRITPDEMEKAADSFGAVGKTRDVALIYAEYVKLINSGYRDAGGLLEKLSEAIETDERILGSHIYIAEFSDFTGLQINVIERLAERAQSVNIALAVKNDGANRRIFSGQAVEKLEKSAFKIGVKLEKHYVKSELMPEKRALCDNLFGYNGGKFNGKNEWFYSFYAASREEETEYVARAIKTLVVERGARYKDIAVVAGVLDGYETAIRRNFSTCGIPYYLDERVALSSTPFATFTFAAINAKIKKFRQKETLEFLKQIVLNIDERELFDFENYALKYNIDRSRFSEPFSIADDAFDAQSLERVRVHLRLTDVFPAVATVAEFCRAIEKLAELANFDFASERIAAVQRDVGFPVQADALLQSPLKIAAILSDLRAVLGDKTVDLETFYGYFASACESVEISSIPLFADSVFIGETEAGRYNSVKYLFVIGATEGSLPVEESGEGIIGLKETRAYAKLGVIIEPDAKKRSTLKKFALLNLMLKPEKKLFITAPLNAGGVKAQPSFAVVQTEKIFGAEKKHVSALINSGGEALTLARTLCTAKGAKELFARSLSELREGGGRSEQADLAFSLCDARELIVPEQTPHTVEKLGSSVWRKEDGKLFTSVSQLEKYFRCPYFHFMEKGVKPKPRELPDLEAAELGTFMHEVLETYFSRYADFDANEEEFASRAKKIFREILNKKEYSVLTETPKNRAITAVLEEEAEHLLKELSRKMKHTKLRPFMTEAEFSKTGEFREMSIETKNKTLYMTGKIDRIDKTGDYVAVIDYKSKSASTLKFGAGEIYRGERIQLFTYLDAVMREGYKPAGVFYLPISGGFSKAEKAEKYSYKGFVTDDTEVLKELDDTLEKDGKSALFPVSVKDGKASGNVLSEADFRAAAVYAKKVAATAAEEIDGGYIAPSPVNGACGYCDYALVCGRDKFEDIERKFGKITFAELKGENDGD